MSTMPDEFELSRRKALAALGTVGAASAGAGVATSAFFSDQETFENNRLVAGTLDVGVGYTAHYSDWSDDETEGLTEDVRMFEGGPAAVGSAADLRDGEIGLPTDDAWLIAVDEDDVETFLDNTLTGAYPNAGIEDDPEQGSVECVDGEASPQADDATRPVIELSDVKPGDFGEVTFDFVLCDNPGYVWLNGALRSASENGTTEPEADDPDEEEGVVELLDVVQAAVWVDDGGDGPGGPEDGNNYQNDGEELLVTESLRDVLGLGSGSAGAALNAALNGDIPARQGGGTGRNCLSAETVHSLAFAWWVPIDHGNEVQGDSVTFDLGLYAEQCRHNDGSGPAATEPLRYEVTTGIGADSGDVFDLSQVGLPRNLTTTVDWAADPVTVTLDLPESLDKTATDRWTLAVDADDDGRADFRLVYDALEYQEFTGSEWSGRPIPSGIGASVHDGGERYVARIPRSSLSDPFAFGGRVRYVDAVPGRSEDILVDVTPEGTDGHARGDASRYQEVFLGGPQAVRFGNLFWDGIEDALTDKPSMVVEIEAFDSAGNPTEIRGLDLFNVRQGNLENFDDPNDANVLETHFIPHNAKKVKLGIGHYVLLANFHETGKISIPGVKVETIDANDSRYITDAQITGGQVFVQTVFSIRCPHLGGWQKVVPANGTWTVEFSEKSLLKKMAGAVGSPVPPNLLSTSFLDYKVDLIVTCKGATRGN